MPNLRCLYCVGWKTHTISNNDDKTELVVDLFIREILSLSDEKWLCSSISTAQSKGVKMCHHPMIWVYLN